MSTFNNFLKVTPAMAKAIGATTEQEFNGKFEAFLETAVANATAHAKLVTDFAALQIAHGETVTALATANITIAAQALKITALETALGNPGAMTEANIKAIAKTEAARVAVEQIGSIGGAPATAAPVNLPAAKAGGKSFTDLIAAEIASGKSKPDAVMAVIKTNPKAHAEWLATGGKL